ncbi:unnamed protein product [Enterobius vermicularis]|uniref:Plasminogen receptor (KT) n=1 Tax=Enterobius vermicularis TaxID=51028 RepID=A0A158Q9M4_ENTVE|nr:unnamed protein product [Enterobius vermicularis]
MLLKRTGLHRIFDRLDREQASRREALEQILEERRRALQLANRREVHKWGSLCGSLVAVIYAFHAWKKKQPFYFLPTTAILVYLAYVADYFRSSRRTSNFDSFSTSSMFPKSKVICLPVTLEAIRNRRLMESLSIAEYD